ncbi:hypothetical protein L2729_02425 [Shewanella gelidimarina]|uniref:hypothetical protein n=1 Tax=Shewanella gelidimarina TaxID=56813 RepID=UPI002010A4F0|nr:hypothetical protein [Shewanella gelidimarina]MCL1056845.1 hypothetical protein [Shewanella gelidimarina]
MVFTVLVFLCLMQNSGMLRTINQVIGNDAPQLSTQILTAASFLDELSLKPCELSEKSLRACMDVPHLSLVLLLLFFIPLLPIVFRQLHWVLDVPILPKPRRIHLSFCRFQE